MSNFEAIAHVWEATHEEKILAIDIDAWALNYIVPQTNEYCLYAIRKCCTALQFVYIQKTAEMCFEALDQRFEVLEFIENQSINMKLFCIHKHVRSLDHIHQQTTICKMYALKKYGSRALKYFRGYTTRFMRMFAYRKRLLI